MTTVFKDVPMPAKGPEGFVSSSLRKLKITDMTFIPIGPNAKTRRAAIYGTAKRLGMEVMVSTRIPEQVPTPAEPSFAVWRTS